MSPSIRTFLLINLLLSVTLITSLAIIGNLFLAHRDIQTQLDMQLIRTSLQMQVLFSDGVRQRNFSLVQKNIEESLNSHLLIMKNTPKLREQMRSFHFQTVFQIWSKRGNLLLHSKLAPKKQLSDGKNGLSNVWLNGELWRVYTDHNKWNTLTFVVAEKSNFREELENQLTKDSIFVMLITYPFLGLLIWVIVGRGLDTLNEVAAAVKSRAATYLKPLNVFALPKEIKPLIDELNRLFKRLQEAFQREKRFAGDAAHELRTPLAALKTQVQVALRAPNEADMREALKKVIIGVDRSTHVVQQLLTLSRMVPDATINEPEPVNLNKKASEVMATLAGEAVKKQIELTLLSDDHAPRILANPIALGILVRNLVDNAIRYTPEGGDVTVKVSHDSTQVTLCVTDNGPGIPEELRTRVFERFFRIIGNKAPGSGLGLGIVQQIAAAHQAELQLLTPASGTGLSVVVKFKVPTGSTLSKTPNKG